MMSSSHAIVTDGSAPADARPRVRVDKDDLLDRMRFTCPRGHMSWEPTTPSRSGHIWCKTCARHAEHDDRVSAEYWAILDRKADETVPWSAVELVGE